MLYLMVILCMNEGLNLTIELSHKAIVDNDGDVIWVKNLTQGTQLQRQIEYTVSSDRRSVTVGAIYAALDSVTYFNGGDVLDGGTDDFCVSAWMRRDGTPANEYLVQKYDGSTGYILNLDSAGWFKTGIIDTGGAISSTSGFSICD